MVVAVSRAENLESYEDGRPRRVKMKVKSAGITDDQVVEYTWTDNKASWTLISASALKAQDASYTLTPTVTRPSSASTSPSTCRCRCPASCSSGDEGRDGDSHRRAAQAGAESEKGRLSYRPPAM